MNMLSIKTKDADTVSRVKAKASDIEISGLNWLKDSIKNGNFVFIVLGGDNPPWDTGLVGIAQIMAAPYDIGYDPNNIKNFKVKISMKVYFTPPITRENLVPYPDTYGTIGIGPIVKWEPNQAITSVSSKNANALFQAILELHPETENDFKAIIPQDVLVNLSKKVHRFVSVESPLGQLPVAGKKTMATGVKYERNRIFFGAPGTGKSYRLATQSGCFGENIECVTFYPTYSFAQFVGTYKPVMNGKDIEYSYVPGPFIRMWMKATTNPEQNFLLVIEELNRANAPAVFGDVFQLMDRLPDGTSEYAIAISEDLKRYLADKGIDQDTLFLPPNLYIWTTMNSADQGVFPLDTAFKRRWDFEYLDIDSNDDAIFHFTVKLGSDGKRYLWNVLRRAINKKLIDCKVNEDKLLGPFFIKPSVFDAGDETFASTFKAKVIMYLFEDAARQVRSKIFPIDDANTYSEICKAFDEKGAGIFGIELDSVDEQAEKST